MKKRINAKGERISDEKSNADFDIVVKNEKKKKRKSTLALLLLFSVIVIVGAYLCVTRLFVIKHIVLENTTEPVVMPSYSEQELLSGFGLEKGTPLFSLDEDKMLQNAKYTLTYIKDVKISRKLPSTLVVKATCERPLYYVSIKDKMYILSDTLKVLDVAKSAEEAEILNLVMLCADNISSCVKGEKIGIDSETEKIILDITKSLDEENSLYGITRLDVTDKFDIMLMYEKRFQVMLGDYKDIREKVKRMNAIIADKKDDITGGVIDITAEYGKPSKYKKFS